MRENRSWFTFPLIEALGGRWQAHGGPGRVVPLGAAMRVTLRRRASRTSRVAGPQPGRLTIYNNARFVPGEVGEPGN
jgi:hypothetical protein